MKSAALHEVFRLGAGTDEGLSCEWTGWVEVGDTYITLDEQQTIQK